MKNVKFKKRNLPNKPSAILRVALEDLITVESMPKKFKIDMGVWYSKKENKNSCTVCHAGAVMACSLGASPLGGNFLEPGDLERMTAAKLYFINEIRQGDIEDGLIELRENGLLTPEEFGKAITHIGADYLEHNDGGVYASKVPTKAARYLKPYREQYKNYIQAVIGIFEQIGI